MRLSELTGYKNRPEYKTLTTAPSLEKFIDSAKKSGYTVYGVGGNGSALKHPGKNYIYKIFSSRSENIGYHAYVNWVLKHPNNPYVPKIGRPTKLANTSHGSTTGPMKRDFYFIRIEILDPAKGENDPRFKKYIDPKYDLKNTDRFKRDFAVAPTLFDHAKGSLWFNDKNYKEIWDFAADQLDMSIDNVMFRGDQLVITDPMA
jgi:hypothetical protein